MRPLAHIAVVFVLVFGAAAGVQLYRYFRLRPKHRDESVPEWPLRHVIRFNAAVLGETVLQRLSGKGK